MNKTKILLRPNEASTWGVEVDGSPCGHISPSAILQLVRYELMRAESSRVARKDDVFIIHCSASAMAPAARRPPQRDSAANSSKPGRTTVP